jgi:alpha-ketoglutarate-dependent taurine dioxygenase
MGSPFNLDDTTGSYERWRDQKLNDAPRTVDELIVEVGDPRALTASEHGALMRCLRRANMAIYAGKVRDQDADIPRLLGHQFGLHTLDANWLAGEDGISEIKVFADGTRTRYIPYTNHPIKWHTDGYYNRPEMQIRGMVLHCVRDAASGGDNRLMDHEIAYLLLREKSADYIHALMQADAMVIPERVDENDGVRSAQGGPVFSIDAGGHLHMRYTARTRSIAWKQDAATQAALGALEDILATIPRHLFASHLTPGMGLLCNNVLHDRSAFSDHPDHPRLLYRARYLERIA